MVTAIGKPKATKPRVIPSGMSVTDSYIINCNKIILARSPASIISPDSKQIAEKIWEIGSQLGVTYEGNVEKIIDKFRDIWRKEMQIGVKKMV